MNDSRFIVAVSSIIAVAVSSASRSSITKGLVEAGIEPLGGSVGNSYDTARSDIINGLYIAYVIHHHGP